MPDPFQLLTNQPSVDKLPAQPPATDADYMRRALHLAAQGWGRTSPNPAVGCVIVNKGRVVGSGWHRRAGTAHAEVTALAEAGDRARGATVYVTLEPCSHHGRTPPCTEALIAAGVSRVVIAHRDPNPLVSGRGVARLKTAGLDVKEGVLAAEAARLNEIFMHWMETGRPFIWWKTAMSMDGKIAARTGHSRWVTGGQARQAVHRLRDRLDAVMVGVGTVLADNPRLDCRLEEGGRDPAIIVADSHARTPVEANILRKNNTAPVYIAVNGDAPNHRVQALQRAGAQVLTVLEPGNGHRQEGKQVYLPGLLTQLAQREITSILLEGGSTLAAGFLQAGLVNKAWLFIAPKIIGGERAPGPVGGQGIANMSQAVPWRFTNLTKCGEDILVEAYP